MELFPLFYRHVIVGDGGDVIAKCFLIKTLDVLTHLWPFVTLSIPSKDSLRTIHDVPDDLMTRSLHAMLQFAHFVH